MGEVGKTYALSVTNEGETYTSKTSILAPTPPVTSYWLTRARNAKSRLLLARSNGSVKSI